MIVHIEDDIWMGKLAVPKRWCAWSGGPENPNPEVDFRANGPPVRESLKMVGNMPREAIYISTKTAHTRCQE